MASTFHLQVVSLDGEMYNGQAQSVSCRTIHGDLAILAHHMNYCTAIGMGPATVVMEDGTRRAAACIGGMLSVMNGECRLMATTWEWSDEIDIERAEASKVKAEERMQHTGISEQDFKMAEAKLHRALVRLGVAKLK
ncbi:MAG: ATP synthase F1 subunit epsilon [Clostridiales bacterium]|nr:ATP synthase F1 subunit epsilon [Clostridiales bacterium]